jgi:fatty acid desaturase
MLRIALHIFPLIEVILIALAGYFMTSHLILSIALLFCAALFLNFSLHITIHHFVHFKSKFEWVNWLLSFVYSILLALPFDFYRIQHFNHHRYNNLKGDVTSTWTEKKGKNVPKNFFKYAFFWFLTKPTSSFMKEAVEKGDLNKYGKLKIRIQLLIILATYITLFLINPLFTLYYGALFYLGWSFIAITNYGQHLPINYGETVGYTYHPKAYNFLFFNNGLHYEHHHDPGLNYDELTFQKKATIRFPHLLAGLFTKTNSIKK